MIGIVHHNPVIISVILDREHFKKQLISNMDIRNDTWREKVEKFSSSPRDGRDRVLFVEKLANLQAMVKQGFDGSVFKIVVYDDCDVLKHLQDIDIVDAKLNNDETWALYKLLPDHLNKALGSTPKGVTQEVQDFDFSKVEAPIKTSAEPKKKKRVVPEQGNPMAETNALMKDLLEGDGLAPESSPPPKPEPVDEEPEPEPEQEPATEPEPEPAPEPETKPEPKPKVKAKEKPKAAPKPETPKPKQEKPKAAALESYKLF